MTNQELTTAIAEKMGLSRCEPPYVTVWRNGLGHTMELPPYLTSHDAIQPVLESMSEEEWNYFSDHAIQLSEGLLWDEYEGCMFALKLTPLQKATCYAKAVGIWKGEG